MWEIAMPPTSVIAQMSSRRPRVRRYAISPPENHRANRLPKFDLGAIVAIDAALWLIIGTAAYALFS